MAVPLEKFSNACAEGDLAFLTFGCDYVSDGVYKTGYDALPPGPGSQHLDCHRQPKVRPLVSSDISQTSSVLGLLGVRVAPRLRFDRHGGHWLLTV